MEKKQKFLASAMVPLIFLALCTGVPGCGSGSAAPASTPNPSPSVTSISPSSAPAGGLAFTLTIKGSNFVPSSTVEWNGNSRTTTVVSSTQLQAHIMAADLATPGKVNVTVVNSAPGGGTSGAVTFTVAMNTVLFLSSRALDGSDAVNTNNTRNVWMMNPDGSVQAPLTKLTSPGINVFDAAWSPDGTKIAFAAARALDGSDAANINNTVNIWVMNADGSAQIPLTNLTASGASSFSPAWSPDGAKIAFSSSRALDGSNNANTASNIWLMNADGAGATSLTKLTAATSFQPVWSPDGSKIAFASARALDGSDTQNTNGTPNIWVTNSDGSTQKALTNLTAITAASILPQWSPDGTTMAFVSQRALDGSNAANLISNVWLMKADGSAATPLTKLTVLGGGVSLNSVSWSPDASKLLFGSSSDLDGFDLANSNSTVNVWVMSADGSSPTPITKLTAANTSILSASNFNAAMWSPDGSRVLFASERALNGSNNAGANATSNIWQMNRDGTGQTPLTKLTALNASSLNPTQP